jgi:hypothetical protein
MPTRHLSATARDIFGFPLRIFSTAKFAKNAKARAFYIFVIFAFFAVKQSEDI